MTAQTRLVGTRLRRTAAAIGIALVALLLVVAAFPWGLLAGHAIGPLSAALDRPVTVGSARRIDWIGLNPEVALSDVRIGQPAWIGAGTMATIREARVRFPVLPLLLGRFRPQSLLLDGVALTLVRNGDGQASWEGRKRKPGAGGRPSIRALVIRGGTVSLDDRRRQARLAGTIAADGRGLAIAAAGTLRGRPLRLDVRGAAVGGGSAGKPYPLHIVARSPLVAMDAAMTLDRPLDTSAFGAHVVASGEDLTYLDDLVQAGLFPTRRFAFAGDIRHDGSDWQVTISRAQVGRSTLTARAHVTRAGERTRLDATVDAAAFDFDDFASAEQHALAAARERAVGDRIVPGTRLELDGLRRLDGTVRLTAHRLLVAPGSPFRALTAMATIDHQRLVLQPLDVALVTGRASGRLIDDDRHGLPAVDIDVALGHGATVEGLIAKSGSIAGPLEGRIRLRGRGTTLRDAIGRASGTVGLVVPRGTTRADYATFAGGDVGKSIGAAVAGSGERTPLRCMVARFVGRDGRLTPAPLLIDTSVARADGRGSIDLASERIDLMMIGRPKHPGLLRSTAPTRVFGTLSHPELDIRPPRARDNVATGVLSRVGYFLKGLKLRASPSQDPPAADADCRALIAQALR